MSRRSGKTSRETLKAVHPDAYRSFKKKYDRLVATRKVLKLPEISAMRELYDSCKPASTVPRQSQLTPERNLDGKAPFTTRDSENAPNGVGEASIGVRDHTCESAHVLSDEGGDDDNGGHRGAPMISTLSCGSLTVGEFARYMLILRGDEALLNEYKRNVDTPHTRLEADRRKNANEVYRKSLAKIFNDPNYKVYGLFPSYIKKLSVDFSGRHRTGDELKKELELFKNGFTRIWQAYNRSGQNESDWHKFISGGNRSMEANFTQKLLVFRYFFYIRYRETELKFISKISRLVDRSGDAGDEEGFGVEPSVSVDDDYCQLDMHRKRRSSSGAITADMIGPIISQTVADAYTSRVA